MRLLVPLDDQLVSEEALRVIVDAAHNAGSTVRLLYVPGSGPDGNGSPTARPPAEERRRLKVEGWHDLDAIAESLRAVHVERVIRFGDLDLAILDEAAAWPADVVALTAGDRMWLSRAVRTGAATDIFGRNGIPAILYTPLPGRRTWNHEGPRPHDPAVAAAAGGSGHRVVSVLEQRGLQGLCGSVGYHGLTR